MNTDYGPIYDQPEFVDVEETGSRKVGLIIGLGLVVVVAVVLGMIFRASRPVNIPAPTSYIAYNAGDSSFSIQQPAGWDSGGSGSGAINSGALFKSGSAKIDVTTDLAGSLMGDMATAQNNQMENLSSTAGVALPPPVPPVEKLHIAAKAEMEEKYKDYQEGDMQTFQTGFGPGRYSEFTADGGMFVGKIHGYRATILGNERRATIIATCPESNWSVLQSAFAQVISSMDRGKS